jgi:hypothetical protein
MIEAQRKPAAPADRTIVAVEDQGKLSDLGNAKVLLDSFFDRGIHNLLVTPDDVTATHWWMLRMQSGLRVAFMGSQEGFARLTRLDGQAHVYEFGRSGKLA